MQIGNNPGKGTPRQSPPFSETCFQDSSGLITPSDLGEYSTKRLVESPQKILTGEKLAGANYSASTFLDKIDFAVASITSKALSAILCP